MVTLVNWTNWYWFRDSELAPLCGVASQQGSGNSAAIPKLAAVR